jgi:hypothetical protein
MIGKHENNHKKTRWVAPRSCVVRRCPAPLREVCVSAEKESRQEKGTVKRVGNAADNRVLHNHMGSPPFLSA